ncbi:MAG: SIS domain-containing protein [Ardenticatenaceae bacterium]|nr:SIS domain-containing protein [Ardenticatenaceae bacterium]
MSDEHGMMPIAATRSEVAVQPDVVARVLAELQEQVRRLAQELAERRTNQVLATGSGDSWFAAQAVRLAFERYAGLLAEPLQAYEYAAYGRPAIDERTAIIVISSSGRPTTTWDALDRALASAASVIAITDNSSPENPFVARPPTRLVPGAVKVGWPTQTTTATIAVLLDLAIALGRARGYLNEAEADRLAARLRAIPVAMMSLLAASEPWAEALAPTLAARRVYTLVGGGPSYAVAQTGAALLAEGPQEVGVALTVEEFHHGLRIATLERGDPVVLIAPAGATDRRARDTARSVNAWGARLIALATSGTHDLLANSPDGLLVPDVEEPLSPLLTLLPLHVLSIQLAALKVAGGYRRPEAVP